MHFTVVFRSHESIDLSFSLVFTPVSIWMQGDRKIVNLYQDVHQDHSGYELGDLRPLLELADVEAKLAQGARNAVVIVQDTGHGSKDDLANLKADLASEGFSVQEIGIGHQ